MSRISIFPPVATVYPNERQLFTARAVPPPAMWRGVTDSGDIKSDFSLEVDAAESTVSGGGAHFLFSGIGVVEFTIDDQCRPTGSNDFVINGFINDVNGFQYIYNIQIDSTTVKVFNEAATEIFTETYSTVSGDIYRMELNAGFRLYRKSAADADFVLKHSRVGLATVVAYPMTYQAIITEDTATAPTRIPPPHLIGDWQLSPLVSFTAPSHGSITTTGPAEATEFFGGTVPGEYTLIAAVEAAADANNVQRATARITIPALQILGSADVTLLPGQKVRFKTNYPEALIAWSVVAGGGSFTQGEFTAGTAPGTSVVRAFADVNDQVADITITVPAQITNTNDYTAAKASEQIDFDTNIPALPFFVSAGLVGSGTGATTAGLPPGLQVGDIMLLFVETANEAVSTPAGWAIVADSPQGTGTGGGAAATRLSVLWKRATASEVGAPIADPGDHVVAQILAFRNCIDTGDPWDVTSGDVEAAATTAVSIPGDTTTVANCLVVLAVANATDTDTSQTSGYVNTDLANLTERVDVNNSQGNGGGFAVITGEKAAIGSYGATTATLATSSVQGRMSIALKPALTTWTASAGSINSSSGAWTAPSLAGQTAKITASNVTTTVTLDVPVLEAFPRTDFKLPWPIDLVKRVLISEAEDGSRTSRVKGRARRSIPVELLVDAVEDVNGAGLNTIQDFWDSHHPGARFILEDPEEAVRLVVYSDSDLRWEHTGAGINIALRVKEA